MIGERELSQYIPKKEFGNLMKAMWLAGSAWIVKDLAECLRILGEPCKISSDDLRVVVRPYGTLWLHWQVVKDRTLAVSVEPLDFMKIGHEIEWGEPDPLPDPSFNPSETVTVPATYPRLFCSDVPVTFSVICQVSREYRSAEDHGRVCPASFRHHAGQIPPIVKTKVLGRALPWLRASFVPLSVYTARRRREVLEVALNELPEMIHETKRIAKKRRKVEDPARLLENAHDRHVHRMAELRKQIATPCVYKETPDPAIYEGFDAMQETDESRELETANGYFLEEFAELEAKYAEAVATARREIAEDATQKHPAKPVSAGPKLTSLLFRGRARKR